MAESAPHQEPLSRTLAGGSECIFDFVCQPCSEDNKTLEAVGFCATCTELLCDECFRYHLKPTPSRHHKLLGLEDAKKDQNFAASRDMCTETCRQHPQEIIKYFCKNHDTLGCSACMTVEHRACKGVQHISKIAIAEANGQEYSGLVQELDTVLLRTRRLIIDSTDNKAKSQQMCDGVLDDVNKTEKEVLEAFQMLKREIQKEADKMKNKQIKKMDENIAVFDHIQQRADTLAQTLKSMKANGQYCKLFTAMKVEKGDIQSLDGKLDKAANDNAVADFKFQSCRELEELLKRKDSLGIICQHDSAANTAILGKQSQQDRDTCNITNLGTQSQQASDTCNITNLGTQSQQASDTCNTTNLGKQSQQASGTCNTTNLGKQSQQASDTCNITNLGKQSQQGNGTCNTTNLGKQSQQASDTCNITNLGTQTQHDSDVSNTTNLGKQSRQANDTSNIAKPTRELQQDSIKSKATKVGEINVKMAGDTIKCAILGLVSLTDGSLVAADCNNKKMKLIDLSQARVVSALSIVPASPYDVTAIDEPGQIAVTLGLQEKILIVKVTVDSLLKDREIKTSGKCWGIASVNSNLVVSLTGPERLEIIDKHGTVLLRIEHDQKGKQLFRNICSVAASKQGDDIDMYATDRDMNRAIRLSATGEVRDIHTSREMRGTRGPAVDHRGAVYVGGDVFNNILQIIPDSREVSVLLSAKDGITSVRSLCYTADTDRLFVGQFSDSILVYQLS